jgi:hypothetical protein
MIWFSKQASEALYGPRHPVVGGEGARMEAALRLVASREPHLEGAALLDALAATGLVDRETAARLQPCYRTFDADRWFAQSLRSLSFRGPSAADEFRLRVGRVMEDVVGRAEIGGVGPDAGVRFGCGAREGIVLAYPQVAFTLGGAAADAVRAAAEEMPDALVVVARNFQAGTAGQLASLLEGMDVPGTLVTVNLLLGIRATALRYGAAPERVIGLLGVGRPLRSPDVARLGERAAA